MNKKIEGRRELSSRNTSWARQSAAFLARAGISPNMISMMSIVFAALASAGFHGTSTGCLSPIAGMVLVIAGIQLRLLMNLMDGMVAVEHGKKSAVGDLYNEVPDRVSDTLIILAAGYVIPTEHHPWLLAGWASGLALTTAYLRNLGGALGLGQHYLGPMAKQHRMFLMTLSALVYPFWSQSFCVAFVVMILGLVITCIRRLNHLATLLRRKAA